MTIKIPSVRPWIKWTGIVVAACLFPLTQRECQDFVVKQIKSSVESRNYFYKLFMNDRLTPDEEFKEAIKNPVSVDAQRLEARIKTDSGYRVDFKEREFAYNHLYSHLTYLLVSHKDWDIWKTEMCPTDVAIARENLDSLFALAITQRELYPIKIPDLIILQEKPDCPFSLGLRNHPGLKEAIKKFGFKLEDFNLE